MSRPFRLSSTELGMDPYGIKEIVFEFDTGEKEILRPKLGEEFGSYELH